MSTAVPQSAERIANINPSAVPVVDREKWCLGLATALYLKKNNLLSGGWDTLHELERRVVEHEAHKLRLVADLVDSADSAKKLSQGLTPEELRGVAALARSGFWKIFTREEVSDLFEYIAELKEAAGND